LPEALQIMPALLMQSWRGDRIDPEAARIQRPAQPAHDAAFAGGIPAFQHHHRALGRAEIGLLN
jgi:hypothetical protein